ARYRQSGPRPEAVQIQQYRGLAEFPRARYRKCLGVGQAAGFNKKTTVFSGLLVIRLRIGPFLVPVALRRSSRKQNAIMQAERPVVPELDRNRADSETRPVGRAANIANGIFCSVFGNRLFQRETAFQRA